QRHRGPVQHRHFAHHRQPPLLLPVRARPAHHPAPPACRYGPCHISRRPIPHPQPPAPPLAPHLPPTPLLRRPGPRLHHHRNCHHPAGAPLPGPSHPCCHHRPCRPAHWRRPGQRP